MNKSNKKRLAILGSTGSIGQSSLDVVANNKEQIDLYAIAAYKSIDILEEQYHKFHPEFIVVIDSVAGKELSSRLAEQPVKVLIGEDELIKIAGLDGVDIVLNAIVGSAGLKASLATVKAGKKLALANKESLVAGGPLFPGLCEKTGARILPVDSEHSAIWQALTAGKEQEVKKLILTCSGGPFRELPASEFSKITVKQALAHPTWKMGGKITIDSATLVNKGLEILEAVVLFSMPVEKIQVVIHPQSVVHSMVEFKDSSIIAQLSEPDMRLPISYALFWPDRIESGYGSINWDKLQKFTFEPPDYKRFPALKLSVEVARTGGTAPAIFNAANEIAVEAFLNYSIKFTEIVDTINETLQIIEICNKPTLDDILDADRRAREVSTKVMEKITC